MNMSATFPTINTTPTELPSINKKLAAVDRLRDKHLSTPRDVQFRSYLDRLLQRDGQGNVIAAPRLYTKNGDARGIAVVEPAGCMVSKPTLRFSRAMQRISLGWAFECPVRLQPKALRSKSCVQAVILRPPAQVR